MSNHREPNFDACDCILYVLCIFKFAMRGNLKGVKKLKKTNFISTQKSRLQKVNYLIHSIMIANVDMVYLEKPHGLIKSRIPNI